MQLRRHIRILMTGFLHFLEEHSIGLLATLLIHLLLITFFLIAKINTQHRQQAVIMQIVFEQDPENSENIQEPDHNAEASSLREEIDLFRNVPVNQAEAQAVQNIDRMVQEIKTELNVRDIAPPEPYEEPLPQKTPSPLPDEAKIYDERFPLNEQGERTIYKGPTTVSYNLDNRTHITMSVPAYKCQGGGTVAVSIAVNRRGYVVSAAIIQERSTTTDPCFIEAAQRAALTARFNMDLAAPEPQPGIITYVFIPQ